LQLEHESHATADLLTHMHAKRRPKRVQTFGQGTTKREDSPTINLDLIRTRVNAIPTIWQS
jgi:hypothetical protein